MLACIGTCVIKPSICFIFKIVAHYQHSTLSSGLASHKDVSSATNPLLRIYYNSRVVLFTLCMGQEAFLDLLYLSKMLEKEKNPLIDVDVRALLFTSLFCGY